MAVMTVAQCEVCKKQHELQRSSYHEPSLWSLPDEWITLTSGNPQIHEASHFCSDVCLAKWVNARLGQSEPAQSSEDYMPVQCKCLSDGKILSLVSGIIYRPENEQDDAPQSTVRRFLLIDGETADEIEGVKWSSGWVSIDPGQSGANKHWVDWDIFKRCHDGSGIQWIDQEAANERS